MIDNSSVSDFLPLDSMGVSLHFTDMQEIPTLGFNMLVRAKRQGQWWMLKGLKPEHRQDIVYQQLLHKEYDILSRMNHGDVVAVEGMEVVDGYGLCIVMEWIDGETLKEWLSRPHDKCEKDKVINQLLDVLEYVHHDQIVHRDLKPENIMATHNGQHVKLIDFGLADTDNYAVLKQPAGTERYMAPEQLEGCPPDVRNDIYSLGVILDGMKLDWIGKRVASKCQKEIDKRYEDVGAVRKAFASYRHRYKLTCWMVVLLLGFSVAGIVYRQYLEPKQTYEVVADFKVGYLRYQSWGGGLVTVQSTSDADSCVEIPRTVSFQGISYLVNEVAAKAFYDHRHLQRVVFPNAELHLMKDAFVGCPHLHSLYFRSNVPPRIGNKLWKTDISQIFESQHFAHVVLYVPKGSASAYKKSEWGAFRYVKEYSE